MGFKLKTLVVIGTDCTGSCKSNYHTITTTSVPKFVDRKGFTSRTLLLNFYGDNAFTKPEFYFFFRHEKSIFFFKCHQNFSLKTAGSDNFFFNIFPVKFDDRNVHHNMLFMLSVFYFSNFQQLNFDIYFPSIIEDNMHCINFFKLFSFEFWFKRSGKIV